MLFSGLRYFPNQQDFGAYTQAFNDIANNSKNISHIFEPAYMALMWIVSVFSNSPAFFFIIVASIGIGLNVLSIKRYMPRYTYLAILFYFVHTYIMREMGAVRAGIAAGICFYWGLKFVQDCKPWKFIIAVLAAMSFHLSAIAFFCVYPIYRMNLKPKTMLYIIGVCAIIGTFMPIGRIASTLPFIGSFSRVSGYIADLSSGLGVWTNPTTLKQLTFAIFGLLFYNQINGIYPNYRIIIVPYFMSVCWLMLWNDFPIIAGRLAMYFSITEVVLVPSLFYAFTKYSRSIVAMFFIILAFAILYLNGITHLTPEMGYYPYKTIFSE